MNLSLIRKHYREDGIFGFLSTSIGQLIAITLEHAYLNPDGTYSSKIPEGLYSCQRGHHKLKLNEDTFTTFQIMNVPFHEGILFHQGNWNHDSEGCILLGRLLSTPSESAWFIRESRFAFHRFMDTQRNCNLFQLQVTNA